MSSFTKQINHTAYVILAEKGLLPDKSAQTFNACPIKLPEGRVLYANINHAAKTVDMTCARWDNLPNQEWERPSLGDCKAALGWSQQDIADYLNVSRGAVQAWLKGTNPTPPSVLQELYIVIQRKYDSLGKWV